ncbi:MAG: GTP pyrophosphokinase [Bacteroidetes bacterium]|uniref:GTP pyrophosphokinase n=1 Tax=Candidatus Gallipaludibacter merdavium TaxID=2840839 RepID=A0A9D9N4K8_9BACT|nr:GTP pyrophosphokinase [Candidatus Gallipaludibacter merdavium]
MSTNKELLEKALSIAVNAHKGQVDKSGAPYIMHPVRVAGKCCTDEERIVALLHDTIEDTEVTQDYLLHEGFPQNIVDAILSVTKEEDESYDDFIKRCRVNPIGRQVKIHDLEDNMDITRLDCLKENDLVRLNKYLKAYQYLLSR